MLAPSEAKRSVRAAKVERRGRHRQLTLGRTTVKMGATMGSLVGLTIGFIFGSFAILRSVSSLSKVEESNAGEAHIDAHATTVTVLDRTASSDLCRRTCFPPLPPLAFSSPVRQLNIARRTCRSLTLQSHSRLGDQDRRLDDEGVGRRADQARKSAGDGDGVRHPVRQACAEARLERRQESRPVRVRQSIARTEQKVISHPIKDFRSRLRSRRDYSDFASTATECDLSPT